MLNAIQRIERRVQRERMVAVTGKDAVDSDEENAEPAADGDDLEGAEQEEDDNNDKDEEGDEDKEETYQSTKGPKDQYDLNDDFIDDSEVRPCVHLNIVTLKMQPQYYRIRHTCVHRLLLCAARNEHHVFSVLKVGVQFIQAIEMRDERKLKHHGFFVNAGSVERVGEKVEIIARARNKKTRNTSGQTKGKASAGAKAKAQVRRRLFVAYFVCLCEYL